MNSITINKTETELFKKRISGKVTYGLKKSASKYLSRHLGAHVSGNQSRFLLWHPEIKQCKSVELEIFIPLQHFTFDKPEQHVNMACYSFPAETVQELACIVLENVPAGDRDSFGAFYQFRLTFKNDESAVVRDPMAWSIPYGIHAPAELYNTEKVRAGRKDSDYFKTLEKTFEGYDEPRIKPSVNLLEIHPSTTTKDGTLQALSNRYKQIASAVKNNNPLTPDEQNLIGFDAIELMPVDPVAEHPEKHQFWNAIHQPKKDGDEITIHLKKPSVINWGYDTVIFGAAALNPSILSTGRPHELLDLIETLHNFPGRPVKVVLDVVYGHADNAALHVMPEEFFAGNSIYGQNIRFQHPLVRAMILEMQRRKMDWGIDGIRVDAAQDFKYYDEKNDQLIQDDEFLKQMSDIKQNVAGVTYKPWMIFEDGRPWPRGDWELASTNREVTIRQEHPHQWAPTIFGYNTPHNYTYWVSKWWRIKELLRFGEKWISGYANHDTLRRGIQANPNEINVNFQLGNSLKMVIGNAYNNPATSLVINGFLPGVPMDFAHALGQAPWCFMRNNDTGYAIKVAAEEAYFTDWQITEIEFRNSRFFKKLKDLGFQSLEGLRRFSKTLYHLVLITGYSPQNIAELLNRFDPPFEVKDWDIEKLTQYAEAWAEDLHIYCNMDMHTDSVNPKKAQFNLDVRRYRLHNPWLNSNFTGQDVFNYREPVDGTVIFYGYRKDPATGKEVVVAANMEGQPRQILISDLNLPVDLSSDWEIALSTPSLKRKEITQPIKLSITQAILFQKKN